MSIAYLEFQRNSSEWSEAPKADNYKEKRKDEDVSLDGSLKSINPAKLFF